MSDPCISQNERNLSKFLDLNASVSGTDYENIHMQFYWYLYRTVLCLSITVPAT